MGARPAGEDERCICPLRWQCDGCTLYLYQITGFEQTDGSADCNWGLTDLGFGGSWCGRDYSHHVLLLDSMHTDT